MDINERGSNGRVKRICQYEKNKQKKTTKIKLQAMQDAPPLQLYPASDKFLM